MAAVLIGAASCGTAAQATTCTDSFARSGNELGGLTFTATQSVTDLTIPDAVAQLHGIALNADYDILEEDAGTGSMLWEQRQNGVTRAIPVLIAVSQTGNQTDVTMTIQLASGVLAGNNGVRQEMCLRLGQMRGGREGVRLAQTMADVVPSGRPTTIDAYMLSNQFARQHNLNAAVIEPRYRGRSFTVTGRLGSVTRTGNSYRLVYDIPQPPLTGLLRPLPGQPTFSISIACDLAPGQNAYALTLRAGRTIRLTGTFAGYDEAYRLMWMSDCRNTPRPPR